MHNWPLGMLEKHLFGTHVSSQTAKNLFQLNVLSKEAPGTLPPGGHGRGRRQAHSSEHLGAARTVCSTLAECSRPSKGSHIDLFPASLMTAVGQGPQCRVGRPKLHRSRTGRFELRPVTGFSTSVPSVHLQFPSTPGVRPCQLPGPLWMSLVGESSPEYLLSNECCHSAACQSSCHESLEGNLKSGLFWLTLLGVHRLGSDGFCLFDYQ